MELIINTQQTPNPEALKYILNRDVKREGKASFNYGDDCYDNTLAHDLLNISNISQVHFFENVITVTKTGGDWDILDPLIRAVIMTRMPTHNPEFQGKPSHAPKKREGLSPEMQKVEEILDRHIRPGLQGDGGDLEVVSLENKLLTIRFQGACGGCPSSSEATLYAIQDILRREFDPDLQVTPEMTY